MQFHSENEALISQKGVGDARNSIPINSIIITFRPRHEGGEMPIECIHTFVVYPRKAGPTEKVNGTSVKMTGKLFDLLKSIYDRSEQECDVDITFLPTNDGKQQNDCRDLLCSYLGDPSLQNGRKLAERLEKHTDKRSGLGLLFLIVGKEGHQQKIVLSRFPTDHAIYVDDDPQKLTVEFLERVFMKNKASYKAVLYQGSSLKSDFWNGRAIDKQINSPSGESSNYWIVDFLLSQLTVTAAQGTRRLASALRKAALNPDMKVKQEIIAAATLATGLRGERLSIDTFNQRFGLSDNAKSAILSELRNPDVARHVFRFDAPEFETVIAFRSIELSNGGTLTAPSNKFDDVFHQEHVDGLDGTVRFKTEGKIVNEKLKPNAK